MKRTSCSDRTEDIRMPEMQNVERETAMFQICFETCFSILTKSGRSHTWSEVELTFARMFGNTIRNFWPSEFHELCIASNEGTQSEAQESACISGKAIENSITLEFEKILYI